MIFDFDPAKDASNRTKHGVRLIFGAKVFEDEDHVVLASFRPIEGEERYKAIGLIEARLWTAVFVERGSTVRLISVRRSNVGEQRNYHRHSG
jgi:uncharacterized protein